jgi:hypothetical protein
MWVLCATFQQRVGHTMARGQRRSKAENPQKTSDLVNSPSSQRHRGQKSHEKPPKGKNGKMLQHDASRSGLGKQLISIR